MSQLVRMILARAERDLAFREVLLNQPQKVAQQFGLSKQELNSLLEVLPGDAVGFDPQPDPPGLPDSPLDEVGLNPQPEPPSSPQTPPGPPDLSSALPGDGANLEPGSLKEPPSPGGSGGEFDGLIGGDRLGSLGSYDGVNFEQPVLDLHDVPPQLSDFGGNMGVPAPHFKEPPGPDGPGGMLGRAANMVGSQEDYEMGFDVPEVDLDDGPAPEADAAPSYLHGSGGDPAKEGGVVLLHSSLPGSSSAPEPLPTTDPSDFGKQLGEDLAGFGTPDLDGEDQRLEPHIVPEVDDEVLVDFEDGERKRPVLIGVLFIVPILILILLGLGGVDLTGWLGNQPGVERVEPTDEPLTDDGGPADVVVVEPQYTPLITEEPIPAINDDPPAIITDEPPVTTQEPPPVTTTEAPPVSTEEPDSGTPVVVGVCGDGVCTVETENSDLCAADCVCVDDGVCSPGEGSGCLDCGSLAGACGTVCTASSQCAGGLACAGGVCWDACTCGGDCGGGTTGGSTGGGTCACVLICTAYDRSGNCINREYRDCTGAVCRP